MLNKEQIEENWKVLQELIANRLGDYSQSFLAMCEELADDFTIDGATYAGFVNAPAGVGQHHNYFGGLVEHLLEMWQVYVQLKPMLPAETKAEVDDAKVLMAIIVHDLHKSYLNYRVLNDDEKTGKNEKRFFAYAERPETRLLNQDQHSALVLSRHTVQLPLIVWNSLYCSEGGYKENPPKDVSALAKLVYLLDEFSSNVIYRMANPRAGVDYIK